MKLSRMLIALALAACLTGVAYVSQLAEPAGVRMANAANQLLATMTPEQKPKAAFAFKDEERLNWHFVPLQDKQKKSTRKGVPLEDMNAEQKKAALNLLRAGTSPGGYTKATTIMSLEAILNELEKGGSSVRNPEWYFFTVFGTPGKSGQWGWRVEGHHLSLNFALDNGKVVASTPAFFGANPATVKDKGLRTLPEAEDLAKELFQALDANQKKVAHQEKQFPEIAGRTSAPKVGEPKGIPAAKMTDKQRGVLLKLLESYTNRMPADIAEKELSDVKSAGVDGIHFAYAGGLEPGQPHSYRIQGPTFVVEFLNVQADSAKNPANHIHSAWRNIKGDFGLAN
jgi:hypothetical protein